MRSACGRLRVGAERDRGRLLLAVAGVRQLDLVAGTVAADRGDQLVGAGDQLVVDLRDDVARPARPASSAAEPSVTSPTAAPSGTTAPPSLDAASRTETPIRAWVGVSPATIWSTIGMHLVDRDREAEADRAAAAAGAGAAGADRGVDADHVAVHVDQGAATVAGVDRGVGLDRRDRRWRCPRRRSRR